MTWSRRYALSYPLGLGPANCYGATVSDAVVCYTCSAPVPATAACYDPDSTDPTVWAARLYHPRAASRDLVRYPCCYALGMRKACCYALAARCVVLSSRMALCGARNCSSVWVYAYVMY
eukprot:1945437-Rhodomonas_salina.1